MNDPKPKIGTVRDSGLGGWLVILGSFIAIGLFCIVMAASTGESAPGSGRLEFTAIPARLVHPGPPPGERTGNTELLHWRLHDRFGRAIGSAVFDCHWHAFQKRYCSGEFSLPLGKITVQGTSETRSLGTWAVTGGTGRYYAKDGELTFRAIGLRKLVISISLT